MIFNQEQRWEFINFPDSIKSSLMALNIAGLKMIREIRKSADADKFTFIINQIKSKNN